MRAGGGAEPTSLGVQAGSRGPGFALHIHVATGSDEFLHFGNGQSESSRTIYRNFETSTLGVCY